MNRVRNEDETYEEYRINLAMEEYKRRNYLKGKFIKVNKGKGNK